MRLTTAIKYHVWSLLTERGWPTRLDLIIVFLMPFFIIGIMHLAIEQQARERGESPPIAEGETRSEWSGPPQPVAGQGGSDTI